MQAVLQQRPLGYTPRRDSGLAGYERVLSRAGLAPVAGVDEAGRGACAGPLVVAAAILRPSRSSAITGIPGLADSKALTAQVREEIYEQIVKAALDWSVVIIPPADIDRLGLHVCNVGGMRRALAGLSRKPGYVLTDGFPVRGLGVPALAMWKGDQVAACVAAASILAKVTRDRIMSELHADHPSYGFARHKGYSTPTHMKALAEHGPCPEHRRSFVNVGGAVKARQATAAALEAADAQAEQEAEEAAEAAEIVAGRAEEAGDPSSLAGSPCDQSADGQNGPIVDLAGDYAWSAASLASGARGA